MDNCWRENKNKYVFGYCSYLVQQGVFKNIVISFFMVGHTHNDLDQLFSRVAVNLKSNNAITIPELHCVIKQSVNNSMTLDSAHIENIPNISDMMESEKWLNPIIDLKYFNNS